jgi:hypothetical protein
MMSRFIVSAFAVAVVGTPVGAVQVPGGGSARTDCYARFEVDVPAAVSTREVQCTDGDPACDRDGACNDSCRFGVALCLNQPDNRPTCIPPFPPDALKSVKLPRRGPASGLQVPALDSSACGAFLDVDVPVKLRKHGKVKRPGKQKLNVKAKSPAKPKNDKDQLRLVCLPRTGDCPTTTTTTTVTTTTTSSTIPVCGDGIVNGAEQCDSPCTQGACGAGQFCNGSCQCVTPETCACGSPDPTQLVFTTRPGMGNCGTVQDAGSADLLALECGGLYFGGGPSAVSLPAVTPDNGMLVMNTCCSGTSLTLAPTTETDTGGDPRSCSGAGCLFGAPLSIPNYITPPLSTCVINEVARNAVGSAECTTGDVNIDLPLTSVVYLSGDLLNGATADRPRVAGTQPCPLCTATCSTMECGNTMTRTVCTPATEVADCGQSGTCSLTPCISDTDCTGGGTCGASPTCLGGPNHGNACTPTASADLGSRCQGGANSNEPCTTNADCAPDMNQPNPVCSFPYPTSHDCPSGGVVIGNLPIPFALTTGTASKTAQDLNGSAEASGADRLFCGFCRDEDASAFFGVCSGGTTPGKVCGLPTDCGGTCTGGTNAGATCVVAETDCPGGTCDNRGTCGGEIPCTSDAECSQPREVCRQRDNGAFRLEPAQQTPKLAATISETGTPAGSLVDHAAHPSTLVSVFCIPPTYSPIDAAASLPGPGAVALVGEAQLVP